MIGNFGIGTTNYFQPANRRTRWLNYFILEDNATKVKGKHEFQFGAHLRLDQWNILPQQTQAAGNVSFTPWRRLSGTASHGPIPRPRR